MLKAGLIHVGWLVLSSVFCRQCGQLTIVTADLTMKICSGEFFFTYS